MAGEDRQDRIGPRLATAEVANLEVLRRQASGAAHTLNNLFTSLLGELALLGDERKDDPVVDETLAVLRELLARCVKLVRNGLARPPLAPYIPGEVDLGLLLSRCRRVFVGTLPRRITVRICVPDEPWLVWGDAAQMEVMLLALIFRLGDLNRSGCMDVTIALREGSAADTVSLDVDLDSRDLVPDARQRLVDPGLDEDPASATSLEAIHAIADRHGTHLRTERIGPEALRLSLVFERQDG